MLKSFRHRLRQFFSAPFGTATTAALKHPNGLHWTPEAFNVLLFNENQNQLVQVELPSRSGPFQTRLLGFDLTQNQLLIDSVFPVPPVELLAQLSHFKLTLFKQQQVLTLQVRIVEHLVSHEKPALIVEVLSKHYQEDRRSQQRFIFERRHAPMARVQIPMQPQWRASLVNVSKGGCLLNIFGKLEMSTIDFKQPIRCQIQLNSSHRLDCLIKIKACEYFRSPCQHMQLRGCFVGLSPEQQGRLNQFIDQLEVPEYALSGVTTGSAPV